MTHWRQAEGEHREKPRGCGVAQGWRWLKLAHLVRGANRSGWGGSCGRRARGRGSRPCPRRRSGRPLLTVGFAGRPGCAAATRRRRRSPTASAAAHGHAPTSRRHDRRPTAAGQRHAGAARRPATLSPAGGHGAAGGGPGCAGQRAAAGGPGGLRLRPLLDAAPVGHLRPHRAVHPGLLLHRREPRRHAGRERPGLERLPEPGSGRPHHAGPRARASAWC